MLMKIIYEGEMRIVPQAQLAGYKGCEVLGRCEDGEEQDDVFALVSGEHLSSVHLQKAIEAVMVLSGYHLPAGLLAEEAETIGVPVAELAAQVHAHRRAQRDFEIERRACKSDKGKN